MSRASASGTRSQRDSGSAMVEFALILPVFMMMLMGALGFGVAFWAQQELSTAAQEGARALYLGRTDAQARDAAVNAVRLSPPFMTQAGDTATVTACSGGQRTVRLVRTHTVDFVLGSRNLTIVGRGVLPC